jgi:hypothetical protein
VTVTLRSLGLVGGGSSSFPSLVNSAGLDRFRTAKASALVADAPVFCGYDSHTFSEYWDGAALQTTDNLCFDKGWPSKVRDLFAATYGDPGEDFWFPGDDRVVTVGGASTGLATGPAILRNNWRPTTVGQTKQVTIPAGKGITRFRIHSGNRAGETGVLTVQKNGGAVASVTSQNNDTPNYVEYACGDGDVFLMTGPSSSAITILGFGLRTAQTHGVPVERMGRMGYTIANLIGGVYNGMYGSPDGTTILTAAQIAAEIRACYQGFDRPNGFVFVLVGGTNENSKQLLSTGLDCGVTPGLYGLVADIVIKQVTADGGCVLLVSPCPAPTEQNTNGAAPLSTYAAMSYSLALTNRHCAFLDIAADPGVGGGFSAIDPSGQPVEVDDVTKAAAVAATGANGDRDPNSSHPGVPLYQSRSYSYANQIFGALNS